MRLVYCGSPAVAVPPLRALVDADHDVALVVTQPDKRRRRRGEPEPTPVRTAAEELGLAVTTPAKAREVTEDVRATGAALGVVVAYGKILPPAFLDALPGGFVNVHYSLLPRWRGAAPVERAILAGDAETGVSLMRIGEGLDDGPVYAVRRTPIGDDETAGEVIERLVGLSSALVVDELPRILDAEPTPQTGDATYADKLTTDEFRLDWTQPARVLHRTVRAGNPRPGAWTEHAGHRLKIWRTRVDPGSGRPTPDRPPGSVHAGAQVQTGKGSLTLVEVQPADKRPMSGHAWLVGHDRQPLRLDGP